MKNGYDQFFKQARQAAQQGGAVHSKKPQKKQPQFQMKSDAKPKFEITAQQLEDHLKKQTGFRAKRKKRPFPWGLVFASTIGLALAGAGTLHADKVENFVKKVEINWMGMASAEEGNSAPAAKPAAVKDESAAAAREPQAVDIDHLGKLNDRKKELDAREEELGRQEAELGQMKSELERRLKDLEDMRGKISEILADRVKIDETKVETLVQMYSNMKAVQAAKVFESMDEDLAVEILSRMKKKNAADIMNLLKPEKAQVFSEKYAGYKRK